VADIARDRVVDELRVAIEDRLRHPPRFPDERFAGRGIVVCAGGPRYFTCAWVLISVLRSVYQTKLPIQVWHLGRCEMSEAMQILLEEQDVEVVNAATALHRYPAKVAGPWPLKPYAIAHSRFREVLSLDADTVPLSDPGSILDWDLYRESGLLFWPDIIDLLETNPIWSNLGLEPRGSLSVESSVLAIDKTRTWNVLDIAILLNEHWRTSYRYVHGDKDTFLLAAILTGAKPAWVEHRPFSAGGDLIQRDIAGDPLFHHRTASKWRLSGENRSLAVPSLMPACDRALAMLRRSWNGVVFHMPDNSKRAHAEEAKIIASKHFCYETGDQTRRLELLRGGTIGEGRTQLEQHWAVIRRDDALVLQLYSESRLAAELTAQLDGSWRGGALGDGGFEARLIPEDAWGSWPSAGSRSAVVEIAALLEPTLFACGFDPETSHELEAALSLLNRLFDDVPEQLASRLKSLPLCATWQGTLEKLTQALKEIRDARLERTVQNHVAPAAINPKHYSRLY
jgi:hypothetical protein